MESQTDHAPDEGHTDMAEHIKTWRGFLSFMKWQAFGAAAVLIFLAIFRTHD
ncbi:MAG: aa3-type cytochrome c oxidase subunit IV [Rhizomicrobium sp.]